MTDKAFDGLDLLKDGERIDDLQNGYRIIQDPIDFCFGMDAVLLADFCQVKPGDTVVDLGTGCGIIPILLAARSKPKKIIGIEIQPKLSERASRSVELNNLNERISIECCDLKDAPEILGHCSAQVVVCNPPFFPASRSAQNHRESVRLARHEIACDIKSCVKSAAELLPTGGRVYFIHRSERAFELMQAMHERKIEPKRFRFIQAFADRAPNLILLEGIKCGKSGLICLPTLIVRNDDRSYSEEVRRIYAMPD